MNRKEKFLQVIKDKGYESVVDLMIAVEAVILKDKTKAYEKATTCKNYYTMIEGTSRDFPREYIIALEKVLDMKYIDMINPLVDDKPKLQYDSLRSIAFANDYEKTKEFALKTANDDQIIFNSDEYNKFFIDYIIEYKAINCLRYIVETDNIRLGFNDNFTSDNSRNYLFTYRRNEQLPIKIANLICEFDDAELFNRMFDSFSSIRFSSFDHKNVYEEEGFAKGILRTNKILESLFEVKELDIDTVNSIHKASFDRKGKYANMLLNTILKVGMKDPIKYEEVLVKILNKAYYINRDIVNFLKQYEDQFKIDDKGFVKVDWIVYGLVVKYPFLVLLEAPMAVKRAIMNLAKPLVELEAKEGNKFGKRLFQVKDNKVYLNASNNPVQYEMMTYMNEKKFTQIPILYEHDEFNNLDIIEFKKPEETSFYFNINKGQVEEIALFLKEFHKLAEKKLGKGKAYLHNNLVYDNCSFKNDLLDGVTDWKYCSIGNPLEDVMFVLFTWTGMANASRFKHEVFEKIQIFIENYELDESLKLGDELLKYLSKSINNLNKESDSYEDDFEAIKFAQAFVELYQDRLNERNY